MTTLTGRVASIPLDERHNLPIIDLWTKTLEQITRKQKRIRELSVTCKELGIPRRSHRLHPEKTFYAVNPDAVCVLMKTITVDNAQLAGVTYSGSPGTGGHRRNGPPSHRTHA